MDWARDRATLWNAAEHAGKDRHSRLGREVLVILPHELGVEQRVSLARRYAQELSDRYGAAVDLAIHDPRPGADARHYHAHLLMTHREVTPGGLGRRTTLELSGQERHARGLCPSREELLHIRERWAEVANAALQAAGIDARIDHRSYKDQGIDREPEPLVPEKVYYAEKKSGKTTQVGEAIRTRHRERVEARRQGVNALQRVIERQREEDRQEARRHFENTTKSPQKLRWSMLTHSEIKQRMRERRTMNAERLTQAGREYYRAHAAEIKERRGRRKRAPEPEAQKLVDPKEEAARRWLDHFARQDAAGGQPKTEEVAQKWLKYLEGQDAAKATHLDGAQAFDQEVESASAEQVEGRRRHAFRRGGEQADGRKAGDAVDEPANEAEAAEGDRQDRDDDRSPEDRR